MKPIDAPRAKHARVQHAVDQAAVADVVDPFDAGRPVGDAGAREQRMDRAPALVDGRVDRFLLGEVQLDGLDPGELHRGVVHHDDLGAEVERQLGRGGAHPGGAAHDEHALAIESECIEERHLGISRFR